MSSKQIRAKISKIQARVQQLYDIPLFDLTHENVTELQTLKQTANDIGYIQSNNNTIYSIHYVPRRKRS